MTKIRKLFMGLVAGALITAASLTMASILTACGFINSVIGQEQPEKNEEYYKEQFYSNLPSQLAKIYSQRNPSANIENVEVVAINWAPLQTACFHFTATKKTINSTSEMFAEVYIRKSELNNATSYEELCNAMKNSNIKINGLFEYNLMKEEYHEEYLAAIKEYVKNDKNIELDLETGLLTNWATEFSFNVQAQKMVNEAGFIFSGEIILFNTRSDTKSSNPSSCYNSLSRVDYSRIPNLSIDDYLNSLKNEKKLSN